MDKLLRYHAWETEMAINAMKYSSIKHNCIIETFTLVVDAEEWSLRLATKDAFSFIENMAKTDSLHYPERLGTVICMCILLYVYVYVYYYVYMYIIICILLYYIIHVIIIIILITLHI